MPRKKIFLFKLIIACTLGIALFFGSGASAFDASSSLSNLSSYSENMTASVLGAVDNFFNYIASFFINDDEVTPEPETFIPNYTVEAPGAQEPPAAAPPVIQVAAPVSNVNLRELIREILNEFSYSSSVGTQGPAGPQGIQGPRGERGPAGTSSSLDTSSFVSASLFDAQTSALLASIERSSENITEAISDQVSTDLILLNGSTSGTVTVRPAAAAGTYSLTLPTNDGDASQVLTTDGSGVLSWATVAASGANTALSNLASVAINTSLVSDTDNTDDLGTSAIGWRTGYFDTSLITPTIIGGSSTTQDLTFQTTSGVGASGADMHFLVGNNGATEAMTILNSGNVGIGDTTPDAKLDLEHANSTANTSTTAQILTYTDSGNISTVTGPFAKIGQDISTTYSGSYTAQTEIFDFIGSKVTTNFNSAVNGGGGGNTAGSYGLQVISGFGGSLAANDGVTVYGANIASQNNIGTTGTTAHYGLSVSASGTADDNYGITVDASGATNNYGIQITSPASGSTNYALYSSATAQSYLNGTLKIGGTALRATTEGTNQLNIFDGTAPVGTLANGISLYSTAGELRVMDAAGNATLLSPHENENNYWVFDSTNDVTGKSLLIDMELIIKDLNDSLELDYVHETQGGELVERGEGSLLGKLFSKVSGWFADAGNSIGDIFADTFYARDKICINQTCVTEAQLQQLLQNAGTTGSSRNTAPDPEPSPTPESDPIPEPDPQSETDQSSSEEPTPEPEAVTEGEPVTEEEAVVGSVPDPEVVPESGPEVAPESAPETSPGPDSTTSTSDSVSEPTP